MKTEENWTYRFSKAAAEAEDDEKDVSTSDDNRSSVRLAQRCKKQGRNGKGEQKYCNLKSTEHGIVLVKVGED